MKLFIVGLFALFTWLSVSADDLTFFPDEDLVFDDPSSTEFPEEIDLDMEDGFAAQDGLTFELATDDEVTDPSLLDKLATASRFTIRQEASYRTEEPREVVNNRSSIRLEFSTFFGSYFFLQFDSKLNLFWRDDHRAKAEEVDYLTDTNSKEAFLQASFGKFSITAGIQVIIWGESDGGTITDVISPRDYSELFFIPLEESRIGQPLLLIDHYSSWGYWSVFYIPDPGFNKHPAAGTAYSYDPFEGQADIQDEKELEDEIRNEYGIRWKKTFGKSDIAIMAASLIENDYAYRWDGYTQSGKLLITKLKPRFSMAGVTFNHATGNFLLKGELGKKSPQSFNDTTYQIVKKDVSDVALGLEYSPGGSYTLGLEIVTSHINGWEDDLLGVPENTNSAVVSWSKSFLHEDLSLSWMSSYTEPYIAWLHSLRTSYQWNDQLTFELNAFYPDIQDEENSFWMYRNEKQVALNAHYQF